jgi:N-acyl homoserine lactone hydrolase
MRTWDVKVLYLGKITANLSITWPAGMPPLSEDFSISAPYLAFLLQSEGQNILIDSGISEKFIVNGKAWGGLPAEGGKDFLLKALAKEGLKPENIGTVIYTHLHNDHAANSTLFTNATLIFQKDEWKNLLYPLPVQLIRKDYDPDIVQELKGAKCLMVDGDIELAEGLRLYKAPGHTLGSQLVVVNTKKGVVVFIGDLALMNFMVFPGTTEIIDMEGKSHKIPAAPPIFGPAVPHNIIYDYYAYYDSIYKMKAIASKDEPGYVIPGHEPSLVVTGI